MATTAKFPGALLTVADVGAEWPSIPAQELVLNADINASVLTVVATSAIPASWPASGWFTIDNEVFKYDSFASATFTINASGRGSQSTYGAGAAAAHTAGATIGSYLTAQAINQFVVELIAMEKQFGSKQDLGTVSSATPTWDWNVGAIVELVLGVNITALTLNNPLDGRFHFLKIKQDGTGTRTIVWPGTVDWGTAAAPTLSTAAGKVDLVTLYYDLSSDKYYGTYALGFAS